MTRCAKVFLIFLFILTSAICLVKYSFNIWSYDDDRDGTDLENWLDENNLLKYKQLFIEKGKFINSTIIFSILRTSFM